MFVVCGPKNPERHTLRTEIVEINSKLAAGEIDAAVSLARKAYINDIVDPLVLSLLAHRREEMGEFDDALKLLIEAANLDPTDSAIHANIGHCFLKMGLPNRGIEAFNQALTLDPDNARAHHGAGLALFSLGDSQSAANAQQRAHVLQPLYPDPLGALALIALQSGQTDLAGYFSDMTLDIEPSEPNAVMVRARLLYDIHDYTGCIAFVTPHLQGKTASPLQKALLERICADAEDALGNFSTAFAHYDRCNELQHEVFARRYQDPNLETAVQLCDRLQTYFENFPSEFRESTALKTLAPPREHVFLIGFPRSGTTLLEQVLASHRDVVALEEKPTLNEAITKYFMLTNDISELVNASNEELDKCRAQYWDHVHSYNIKFSGKVFVDKQPSLTLYIPLIKKLFPNSKILFCIRDPRDVVLSCYRRPFTMNTTIYTFTRLNTLCDYYARVMKLGQTYLSRIPIDCHWHKHEAFVTDFEEELLRLCKFMNLEYDPNMRNFVATALRRDIRTPSAAQVRAGLNATGVGYWRNYQEALAPYTDILLPWVERFGY